MAEKPTYEELKKRVADLEEKVRQATRLRDQSIEALTKAEEKFRLIGESSLDDIWQLDMAGKITYSSPAKKKNLRIR